MTKNITTFITILSVVGCGASAAGPGSSNVPPIVTRVVVFNAGPSSQPIHVIGEKGSGQEFAYLPASQLAVGDSIIARYNFDTVHTNVDTVKYLRFTTPPRLQEVIVNLVLGDGTPEPPDTVLRIVLSDASFAVQQPTCTDLRFDRRTDLICKQVTVVVSDRVVGDTVAASIGSGRVTLATGGCFTGWTVTDPTVDSVSVANYASPSAAMFGGAFYGTNWVNGQQGTVLTEQLDSVVAGHAYWTLTHTGTCP